MKENKKRFGKKKWQFSMRLDICDKLMLDDGMKQTGLSASGFVRFAMKQTLRGLRKGDINGPKKE